MSTENPILTEPTSPRSLRSAHECVRRRTMLDQPHMMALTSFTARLRDQSRGSVPDFDPLDGGVGARVLFLFEKPGPMTDPLGARVGSGFISRDNDDPTAEATFRFMRQATLPRSRTVLWNLIPWWNGTTKLSRTELLAGAQAAEDIVELLPDLRAIVLVGAKAGTLEARLSKLALPVFRSPHPSPIVRASRREMWNSIPEVWSRVRPLIE